MNFAERYVQLAQEHAANGGTIDQAQAVMFKALAQHRAPDATEAEQEAIVARMQREVETGVRQ